jgi:proteasome accessory factor C
MSAGRTAQARLERLLHVLPAASRPGGARLADLAASLDVAESVVLEDLEEVTHRSFYHPGGWPDDVEILVEADRVQVTRAGGLDRPGRLTPEETLCLALALRGSAAAALLPSSDQRNLLLERAEAFLAHRKWTGPGAPRVAAPERDPDPEGIREVLTTAARERRACALTYVKSGAENATARVIHPYALAYGEGLWYAIGYCLVEENIRVFRIDRILAADLAEGTFEVPGDFDVRTYLDAGRVFLPTREREVRVRYSPRIARWVRERASWTADAIELDEDGSVVVRHRVADPHWVVSHALQYGAEAEILEPHDLRMLAHHVAQRMLDVPDAGAA